MMTAHDRVLLALADVGETMGGELAAATGLGDQTRRAVRKLVDEGFATRDSAQGRIRITDAAAAASGFGPIR